MLKEAPSGVAHEGAQAGKKRASERTVAGP